MTSTTKTAHAMAQAIMLQENPRETELISKQVAISAVRKMKTGSTLTRAILEIDKAAAVDVYALAAAYLELAAEVERLRDAFKRLDESRLADINYHNDYDHAVACFPSDDWLHCVEVLDAVMAAEKGQER
jgi:hypothetical protein